MVNYGSLRGRVLSSFSRSRVRFTAIAVGGAAALAGVVAVPVVAANSSADVEKAGITVAAPAQKADAGIGKVVAPKPGSNPAVDKRTSGKATRQKPVAPKAAPKKPPVPAWKELHPYQIPAGQQTFTPSMEQLRNAKAIVDAGKEMGLPPRAWVIAVATSLQESTLMNLGHLGANNDHDSQGLFQQRPSSGWGTPKQITNPKYASKSFYKGLLQVKGWKKRSLTSAAQEVQVSAFPNHYAKWERQAGSIIKALHGAGPYAKHAR